MSDPKKRLKQIHRERLRPWLAQLIDAWVSGNAGEEHCPLCNEEAIRFRRSRKKWWDVCAYCPVWRDDARNTPKSNCSDYMPTTNNGDPDGPRILRWLRRELKRAEKESSDE